jgi:tetratricopeptide (TPR) repeat protein
MRFLLIFLIFNVSISFGQTVPEEAQKHYYRGQAAMEMAKVPADYESAIAEYTKAINLAPNWPDAQFALGQVYEKIGKYAEAIASYKKYLQLAPTAANAETVKANIYKLEYKLDKVNEKQKIITALTSYRFKVISGELKLFYCGYINKFIQSGDNLKVFLSCPSSLDFEHTVPAMFDGSKLTFKFSTYNCPQAPSLRQYPCEWKVTIEAELISTSPVRFKVKETMDSQFEKGLQNIYFSEWEFSQ